MKRQLIDRSRRHPISNIHEIPFEPRGSRHTRQPWVLRNLGKETIVAEKHAESKMRIFLFRGMMFLGFFLSMKIEGKRELQGPGKKQRGKDSKGLREMNWAKRQKITGPSDDYKSSPAVHILSLRSLLDTAITSVYLYTYISMEHSHTAICSLWEKASPIYFIE